MKLKTIRYPILVLTIMAALAIACGGSDGTPTEAPPAESPTEAPPAEVPTEAPPPPTEAPPPTEEPMPAEPELYRQWGFGAFASSQFGEDGWSASQADGEPDTPECGDNTTAWASESYDTVENITLLYEPVYVTEVNIYQSYNPDHVVQVELIAFDDDTAYTVYTQEPEPVDSPCPYVLSIVMDEMTDFLVYAVRVTVDQTALNDWNEIDAVELVGSLEGMAGGGDDGRLRQWASNAVATSQFGEDSWSAMQATGEPDTLECGDSLYAWASMDYTTIETLDVYFDTPVYANEINIYQSYNPDHVSEIALIDENGEYVTIYNQTPEVIESPCPYVLNISNDEPTDFLVYGVSITVDQTTLNDWNEIDAVELVGYTE